MATDFDRNRNAMIAGGQVKETDNKVIWTSDPLPNDAIVLPTDAPAEPRASQVQKILTAITQEQAKTLLPNRYTGFVAATHANYAPIEKAGIAVGKIKAKTWTWPDLTRAEAALQKIEQTGPGDHARPAASVAAAGRHRRLLRRVVGSGGRRFAQARNRPAQIVGAGSSAPGRRDRRAAAVSVPTAETVAMAAIGTTLATLLAIPMRCSPAGTSRRFPFLYHPARWFLNALRGIDSFVFALLFVAAVGLGPFAGVLGIALHTWGSAAKLFADHIESMNLDPFEAVRATGAGRWTAIAFALVPDMLPHVLSTTLYWWEFNVRASTVLGVVGAGGIGQELKNSMDLLNFARLFTIIAVILVVVTMLDQLSGWLRRRLARA